MSDYIKIISGRFRDGAKSAYLTPRRAIEFYGSVVGWDNYSDGGFKVEFLSKSGRVEVSASDCFDPATLDLAKRVLFDDAKRRGCEFELRLSIVRRRV